jgi:hypothetical protein
MAGIGVDHQRQLAPPARCQQIHLAPPTARLPRPEPGVRPAGKGPGCSGRLRQNECVFAAAHVLVKAALTATLSPGPLGAFYPRLRARRR